MIPEQLLSDTVYKKSTRRSILIHGLFRDTITNAADFRFEVRWNKKEKKKKKFSRTNFHRKLFVFDQSIR